MRNPLCPEPQEVAFAVLYLSLMGRLIAAGAMASLDFAVLLAVAMGHFLFVLWCARTPSPERWLLRRWAVVPAMLLSYFRLGDWVGHLGGARASWLQEIDRLCFGSPAGGWLESWQTPWLTEVLSFAYLIFHPLIAYALWRHARRPGEHSAAVLRTLGVLWGLGFLGYSLLPAAGPYLETPERFSTPLSGGWLTSLNTWFILKGSNRVDCFPRLHCAISGAILLFEWRRSRLAGLCLTPLVAALWLSTIYLRQHYLVDVAAGALLLAIVYGLFGLGGGTDGRSK
jgi:hypothetical protein